MVPRRPGRRGGEQGRPVTNRIIVGISGASGAILGIRTLEALRVAGVETHLVVSKSALLTISSETDVTLAQVRDLADVTYKADNVGATIASGSFRTMGMIVIPCSMRSLSEIAYGNTTTLLTRAADVVLKERRKLVLVVRETPLHLGHLKTMTRAAEIGAVIAPFMPALYTRPQTIDDIVNHTVGRVLDQFDIDTGAVKRWGEQVPAIGET
jgi:4-hydroxy-3-polyprenylbenzoate decarboxylase